MLTDLVKLNNDEIVPIVKNLAFLKGTVEATVVIDEESEKLANDLRMKINSLVKGAEARRKEITDPINAEAKKVKKMFDDVIAVLRPSRPVGQENNPLHKGEATATT